MFRKRFHCVLGGDGGELNSPSRRANSRICYKLVRWFVTRPHEAPPTEPLESQPVSLWLPYRRGAGRIPDLWRLTSPLPGIARSRRSRCYAARAKSRSPVVFCHLFNEVRWHLGLQSATGRPCRTRASPYTYILSHARIRRSNDDRRRLAFPEPLTQFARRWPK